jgi:hypothetical protein
MNLNMKKTWTFNYNGVTIQVNNQALSCEMLINGVKVDEQKGIALSASLTGQLETGELVRAQIVGKKSLDCKLTVNGKPVEADSAS